MLFGQKVKRTEELPLRGFKWGRGKLSEGSKFVIARRGHPATSFPSINRASLEMELTKRTEFSCA